MKWVKFILGVLFILAGVLMFLLSGWTGYTIRNLIEIGSLMQISLLVFVVGIYLVWVRDRNGLPGIGKIFIVVAIVFALLFMYLNFVPGVATKIKDFPTNVNFIQDQTYSYNQHQIKWGQYNVELRSLELSLTDLDTGNVHKIMNAPRSAALGDDFAVWVAEARNPNARKRDDGIALEFDVWKYDFNTKLEILLLEQFDNNLNPNRVPIAVSERKAVLSTFANKLILLDVDSKQVKEIPMLEGYTIQNDSIHFFKDRIIFPAYVNGTYHTDILFAYDVKKQTFDKVYEISDSSGYGISDVKSTNDGKLYWGEFREWAPRKYYMLDL
jgi:hypothetical protein